MCRPQVTALSSGLTRIFGSAGCPYSHDLAKGAQLRGLLARAWHQRSTAWGFCHRDFISTQVCESRGIQREISVVVSEIWSFVAGL